VATIENIHIELLEQAGFAVVTVSYEVRGNRQDVLNHTHYREVARLVGDDSGPGEDGVDDVLPDLIAFDASTTFRDTKPIPRSERLILPSAVLDEDRRSPFGGPERENEIRLRVRSSAMP